MFNVGTLKLSIGSSFIFIYMKFNAIRHTTVINDVLFQWWHNKKEFVAWSKYSDNLKMFGWTVGKANNSFISISIWFDLFKMYDFFYVKMLFIYGFQRLKFQFINSLAVEIIRLEIQLQLPNGRSQYWQRCPKPKSSNNSKLLSDQMNENAF